MVWITITDPNAWLAWCAKCRGGMCVQYVPRPKGQFLCWNCGGPNLLKQYPKAVVIV